MFQEKKSPNLSVSPSVFPLPVFMARATILCRLETCRWHVSGEEKPQPFGQGLVFALPIFTASHPATIVGANELNFCVRDGNRWTLAAINTNYFIILKAIAFNTLYMLPLTAQQTSVAFASGSDEP